MPKLTVSIADLTPHELSVDTRYLNRTGTLQVFQAPDGQVLDISSWGKSAYPHLNYSVFVIADYISDLLGNFDRYVDLSPFCKFVTDSNSTKLVESALVEISLAANVPPALYHKVRGHHPSISWGENALWLAQRIDEISPRPRRVRSFSAYRTGTLVAHANGTKTHVFNVKREHATNNPSQIGAGLVDSTLPILQRSVAKKETELFDPFVATASTALAQLGFWWATDNVPSVFATRTLFPTVQGILATKATADAVGAHFGLVGVRPYTNMTPEGYLVFAPDDHIGAIVQEELKSKFGVIMPIDQIQVGGDGGEHMEKYYRLQDLSFPLDS